MMTPFGLHVPFVMLFFGFALVYVAAKSIGGRR